MVPYKSIQVAMAWKRLLALLSILTCSGSVVAPGYRPDPPGPSEGSGLEEDGGNSTTEQGGTSGGSETTIRDIVIAIEAGLDALPQIIPGDNPPLPLSYSPYQPSDANSTFTPGGLNSSNSACIANDTKAICLPTGTFEFGAFGSSLGQTAYFDLDYAVYLVMPIGASLTLEGTAQKGRSADSKAYTTNVTVTSSGEANAFNKDLESRIDYLSQRKQWAQIIVQLPSNPPCACAFEGTGYQGDFVCYPPGNSSTFDGVLMSSFALFGGVRLDVVWERHDGSFVHATTQQDVPDVSELVGVLDGQIWAFNITVL